MSPPGGGVCSLTRRISSWMESGACMKPLGLGGRSAASCSRFHRENIWPRHFMEINTAVPHSMPLPAQRLRNVARNDPKHHSPIAQLDVARGETTTYCASGVGWVFAHAFPCAPSPCGNEFRTCSRILAGRGEKVIRRETRPRGITGSQRVRGPSCGITSHRGATGPAAQARQAMPSATRRAAICM